MSETQTSLEVFCDGFGGVSAGGEEEWLPEEWGPTMEYPIPIEEFEYLTDRVVKRELNGTGLCPGDFELVGGRMLPDAVREKGFHPDDQSRAERDREVRGEGAERALAIQHELL